MTTALEGDEWSAARPGRTLPWEKPGTHCTGDWVGPRAGLDGWKKLSSYTAPIYSKHCLQFRVRVNPGFL